MAEIPGSSDQHDVVQPLLVGHLLVLLRKTKLSAEAAWLGALVVRMHWNEDVRLYKTSYSGELPLPRMLSDARHDPLGKGWKDRSLHEWQRMHLVALWPPGDRLGRVDPFA